MLSAGRCMWLTSSVCIISALSLLGVTARGGGFRVCKQVLLVNKWLICGIDRWQKAWNQVWCWLHCPFWKAGYLSVQLTSRRFLDNSFVFHACPLCVSESVSNYLYGCVKVHSFLELQLSCLFQEWPFNHKLSFQKGVRTEDTTNLVKGWVSF